jgi:hypothetical protein
MVKLMAIIFSPPFEAFLYTHLTENNTFDNLFGSGRSLIPLVRDSGLTPDLWEDKGEGSSGDSSELLFLIK